MAIRSGRENFFLAGEKLGCRSGLPKGGMSDEGLDYIWHIPQLLDAKRLTRCKSTAGQLQFQL